MTGPRFITADDAGLLIDQYELTMVQSCLREGMHAPATFDLYVRDLPAQRSYLLACGVDEAIDLACSLRFPAPAIERLATLGVFDRILLDYLSDFRFTGDIRAMPEGTPCFGDEPVMEVTAPLPEAQLLETLLLNQVAMSTTLASKASVVVQAARGRAPVVDFGLRRMHGLDVGLKSAHAFAVAGAQATSNVLGGLVYDVPVTGTMAHSYIEAFDDEMDAFETFAREFGATTLLIDTYDTIRGARRVVELSKKMAGDFRVRAVRLDSGDLLDLSRRVREILDDAGLTDMKIFASGGLDERKIRELVDADAPIDGYGVGTAMGVSADAPALDTAAYKLIEYDGKGRMKLSSGKSTLPGRKQVYRQHDDNGVATHDVIAGADEHVEGKPLLERAVADGKPITQRSRTTAEAREYTAAMLEFLPAALLDPFEHARPYEVRITTALECRTAELREQITRGAHEP